MKTINKHVHLKLIWTMTCIFLSGQLVQAQNEPPSLDINAHFSLRRTSVCLHLKYLILSNTEIWG